ncbi:MAG: PASTA domain-containing protein, partial [Spirochaetota bacterium]
PEVVVPSVTDNSLMEGLIILQKKNLRAIIDPRYFSNKEKNSIVDQEPAPGSVVKEGQDIKLVVSKGPIISIMENYQGKTITHVQNRLQEIFTFQGKKINIGNITYVSSDEPEGIIVGQFPPPGTAIADVDKIDLMVSRGEEIQAFKIKNYIGMEVNQVMQTLALRGVLVNVVTEEVMDPSKNGIILDQEPPPDTVVKRNDTVTLDVGYLPSEKGKDKLYARVLNFDVPSDAEKANIRIVVNDKIGEREIYNAENKGGESISVPFKSYSDTTVYIYLNQGLNEVRKFE